MVVEIIADNSDYKGLVARVVDAFPDSVHVLVEGVVMSFHVSEVRWLDTN